MAQQLVLTAGVCAALEDRNGRTQISRARNQVIAEQVGAWGETIRQFLSPVKQKNYILFDKKLRLFLHF